MLARKLKGYTGLSADISYGSYLMTNLAEGTASPQQEAAMYLLLADLPGVFNAGRVTDRAGRTGNAIGIEISDAKRSLTTDTVYLIVDQRSGEPFQVEHVYTPAPPPALHLPSRPTVAEFHVFLRASYVRQLGDIH